MADKRVEALARNLVRYSCRVKEGEKVYIHYTGQDTTPLAKELIKQVYQVGALPFVHFTDPRLQREMLLGCTEEQLRLMAQVDSLEMSNMDAYIGIRGGDNAAELSDVPGEKMDLYGKLYSDPVHHGIRVPKTKWCVLRYPNGSMAQSANMSLDAFEDYYFDVCCVDYSKMAAAMEPLKKLMEQTDRVRITGPGTDLSFSIKGIPAVPCAGDCNIPDGEIYTAPVRESVNGTLSYNTPSLYQGVVYENIKFTFKDGKIVEATANETEKLNQVLNTDEGARYVGEFALGVNPYVTFPMKDTLFDEKICGSFHFTPGACYEMEAPNGNHSAIHWDLVCIQTPEYGGGEIYFDDVLIRKDGRFVLPQLAGLNPENLK